MTSVLSFSRELNPHPVVPDRRAEILADPGFGRYFTDHMVTIRWNTEKGWHEAKVMPYRPIECDPATMVFHYGQAIFEGLKAYRQPDGSIASFRPDANAARFRSSACRMAMPELPEDLFLTSLRELVTVDSQWVPSDEEESLYLRPFMIATEATVGVHPANKYLYTLIASPAGSYFARGINPVRVWLSTEYVRAAPGGTGAVKAAGNYAATLLAQAQATEQGCDQVVWLDAIERRWVEEMGTNNLFFVFGSDSGAQLVTPELTGTLLPGIIRDSVLRLGKDLGYSVQERRISIEEWENKVISGEITEVFACGTAAVITPVGSVKHAENEFTIGFGEPGKVTMRLRQALTEIQHGTTADPYGWMTQLA